jgi:hypothetical protein
VIYLRGFEGESEVEHGKGSEVFIVTLCEIELGDLTGEVHLQHF